MIPTINSSIQDFKLFIKSKKDPLIQQWNDLPKEVRKTAMKVIAAATVLSFLVWSLFRLYRRCYASPISTTINHPTNTNPDPISQAPNGKKQQNSVTPPIMDDSSSTLTTGDQPTNTNLSPTSGSQAFAETEKQNLAAPQPSTTPSSSILNAESTIQNSIFNETSNNDNQGWEKESESDSDDESISNSAYFTPDEDESFPTLNPEELTAKLTPIALQQNTSSNIDPPDQQGLSPLEELRKALHGHNLTCELKRKKETEIITFANLLLATLFREKEIQSCTFDDKGHFKFTYATSKTIQIQQLPTAAWDQMPKFAQPFVSAFMKIAPALEISNSIEGKMIKNKQGIKIDLHQNAFVLAKNWLGYTASLKSISVDQDASTSTGYSLNIDSEHNMSKLDKAGVADYQILAQALDMNFFPEHYS